MKKLINQILKFGIVGIIAFIIDYSVLWLLTEFFDVYYMLSATISFCVSVIFNYLASMRYVFDSKDDISKIKEFIIFVFLSVVGLLINDGLMYIGTTMISIHYMISKIFATAVVMVWNFVSRKIFLEKKE